jgi:hypothetical protein
VEASASDMVRLALDENFNQEFARGLLPHKRNLDFLILQKGNKGHILTINIWQQTNM